MRGLAHGFEGGRPLRPINPARRILEAVLQELGPAVVEVIAHLDLPQLNEAIVSR
jgi:hypothetical protein